MAERNTCSWNTFWLRKVFHVAKSFWLYENTSHEQVLQWNKSINETKGYQVWAEEKFSSEMRLFLQKVNINVNVNFFKL